jgi:hypothetical protein
LWKYREKMSESSWEPKVDTEPFWTHSFFFCWSAFSHSYDMALVSDPLLFDVYNLSLGSPSYISVVLLWMTPRTLLSAYLNFKFQASFLLSSISIWNATKTHTLKKQSFQTNCPSQFSFFFQDKSRNASATGVPFGFPPFLTPSQ